MKCFAVKTQATIFDSVGSTIKNKTINEIFTREELALDSVFWGNTLAKFGPQQAIKQLSYIPFNLIKKVENNGGYLFRRFGIQTNNPYYVYVPENQVTVI